jgi:hypothetical protein
MTELLRSLQTRVKGKKTYVVGALMVLLGILTGDVQMMAEGLAFSTIRAGIASTSK